MSYNYLPLDRKWLNFEQVKNLLDYQQHVSITFDAHERILKCREYLDNKEALSENIDNESQLSDGKKSKEKISNLENNAIISRACGSGEEVPADIVKLMLMLKIKSLSYGHSGVSIETVKRLMEMYNKEVYPVIYTQSGDITALSHLSLPLLGFGEVCYKGEKRKSVDVLQELKWQPLHLLSREGEALVTGTQFVTAYGVYTLKKSEQLLKLADIIAALSFDAFDCSPQIFNEKLQSLHKHEGQAQTVAVISKYLQGSKIRNPRTPNLRDPSSFTYVPQIHGAAKDTFDYVLNVFLKEMNSVTDNQNIFPAEDFILSGSNSISQPLANAINFLAVSIAELANLSEKRTVQIISGQRDIPLWLTPNSELNTSFKFFHQTAATLVSENKQLCNLALVDNMLSAANTDDFISTSGSAGVRSLKVISNAEKVLAVELISAAKAIELKKNPSTSPFLAQFFKDFSHSVQLAEEDQLFYNHINKSVKFIASFEA